MNIYGRILDGLLFFPVILTMISVVLMTPVWFIPVYIITGMTPRDVLIWFGEKIEQLDSWMDENFEK
jgi:hypothetical protein